MRKEIRGTGMMTEEVFYFESAKDHEKYMERLFAQTESDFELTIARIEKWLSEHSNTHGIQDRDVELLRNNIELAGKHIDMNYASAAAHQGMLIGRRFARMQIASEWEKFALRGKRIAESKRGPSRLYREAAVVLKEQGTKCPAKIVRRALASTGVTSEKSGTLHWTDDRGTKRKTTVKQFTDHLTTLRKSSS